MEARGCGGQSGRSRLPLALPWRWPPPGGDVPAPAAQRRHRPGRRGREIVLHGLPARPRGGLPQRPAPDRARRPGRRHRHAGAARPGGRRGACSSGSARRPILGRRVAGAGISLLLVAVDLPLSAWQPPARGRRRAVDPGLARLARRRGASRPAIGAGFAAVGGALALALVRRFRRHWWAPGALVVIAFGVITIWLFPVVIDPIFNDFKKLPPGQTRSDVLELARQGGRRRGGGLPGRREPPHDGCQRLRQRARPLEAGRAVRQPDRRNSRATRSGWSWRHELGHQKHDDVIRGLVWLALVAPAGTFLTQRLAEALRPALGAGRPEPASRARPRCRRSRSPWRSRRSASPPRRTCSRAQVEASADSFALRITDDPAAFIQLRAPARAAQHLRPRPARPLADPVRHAPHDARADRDRQGLRGAQLGCRTACARDRARRPRARLVRASRRPPTGERRRPTGSPASCARPAAARCGWRRSTRTAATGGRWGCSTPRRARGRASGGGPPRWSAGSRPPPSTTTSPAGGSGFGAARCRTARPGTSSPRRATPTPSAPSSSSPTTTPPTRASSSTRPCRAWRWSGCRAARQADQSVPIIFGVFLGPLLLALWGLTGRRLLSALGTFFAARRRRAMADIGAQRGRPGRQRQPQRGRGDRGAGALARRETRRRGCA